MRRRLPSSAIVTLLIGLLAPSVAGAQDELITLADDPFEVTDPNATPPNEATLSVVGSYEPAAQGRVRSTAGVESEASFGIAPNLDVRFGQAGAYGNLDIRRRIGTIASDKPGSSDQATWAMLGGTTRIGALCQFSEERGAMPAIGLLSRVRALCEPGRAAYDTEAIALFSKTLVGGDLPLGVSLNLGGVPRVDPQQGERANRYLVNASIGKAISRGIALVATYAREQQDRGDQDFSLVQVGVRHRLRRQQAILGLAASFGLNRDSPQVQFAAAVQ